jgi:hypothetical protein
MEIYVIGVCSRLAPAKVYERRDLGAVVGRGYFEKLNKTIQHTARARQASSDSISKASPSIIASYTLPPAGQGNTMSLNKSFTGRLFPSSGKRTHDPATMPSTPTTSTNAPNPRNNNHMSETNGVGGSRNGETIVNRLHDAINVYRQERDDIFRRKETAKERLRLVKEEKEALTKSVQMMQDKAGQLTERITTSKQKIETVRHDVLRLTSEVSLGSKWKGFYESVISSTESFLGLVVCNIPSVGVHNHTTGQLSTFGIVGCSGQDQTDRGPVRHGRPGTRQHPRRDS